MATSSLGTLTLDLVANTGGFTEPLSKAERLTKAQMKAMGMAVDEFGNYTDKAMKKAADATQVLDAQFEKLSDNLKREVALYGDTSRAAQMRYDLEKGALAGLSTAQKDSLTEQTRRLAAMESANAAFREQAAVMDRVNGLYVQQNAAMQQEIALYGQSSREAKIRYEIERGALATLNKDKQFKLLLDARSLDAMDAEAEKSRQLAAATKQLDTQNDQLNESMLAQLSTYGQVTRAAQLRYRMEMGDLKGLSAARKAESLALATQLDALDKAAMGSMRGIRGVATGIGYQMQDIAVQLQMGTNPLMVFAQQGSQIASLFGPTGAVVGAVIAIGGAMAGALIPALFDTGDAAEEVKDKISGLVSEMDRLNDAQRDVVKTANSYRIDDKQAEYDELTASIEKQRKEIERLNEENGKTRGEVGPAAAFGQYAGSGYFREDVDNTDKLAEATRNLDEAKAGLLATELELKDLQDPRGKAQREELADLQKQIELRGLEKEALYAMEAAQKEYTGAKFEEYVYNKLILAQFDELDEKRKTEADAAKKAAEAEKSRAESIAKTIAGMEREVAMYGVSSKAAQMEYDIVKGLVKVKGGLNGVEAQRLIGLAKTQDALDAQKASQDEYVSKLEDWVKAENARVTDKDKMVQALKDEELQLNMTADAYLEMQLRAKGASDDEVAGHIARAQRIRERKAQIKDIADAESEAAKRTEEMWNRLDGVAANIWTDMLNGSKTAWDGVKDLALSTIAEIAHEAYTRPIIMRFQQQFTASQATQGVQQGQQAGQAVAAGGLYAAIAVAVVAGVNIWNKAQEEKFAKMTAEYRQGTQSMGTLFGIANAKSDSIAKAIESLGDISGDVLNVNYGMYQTLLDIRTGIAGVSAGFSKTLTGAGITGIPEGTSTQGLNSTKKNVGESLFRGLANPAAGTFGLDSPIADFVTGFMNGIVDKIDKAIYSKKIKIIDSGIAIGMGQTLADIMESGVLDAFAYADVQTKKKTFGITTSNKVKTQTEELDDVLLGQFADVFSGAGEALGLAAEAFGLDFDKYIDSLTIDAKKLSLKGLEGDALTAEIEAFFSSTLDNWAGVLVEGTDVLSKFQEIGEGAFETVLRLASELNTFNHYVGLLELDFSATGFAAVEASQAIADAAGGFDALSASLGSYYQNFFIEEERAAKQMGMLGDALADLGISKVPETREAFREIIEGLDLTVAADQELFASLIGLSGVFAELVDWSEETKVSVRDANSILQERLGLERTLLELQGDTAELRRRELDALDPSNRALQEHIWALQDEKVAAEEAAKAARDMFGELQKSISAEKERINSIVESSRNAKEALDKSIDAERSELEKQYNSRIEGLKGLAEQERKVLEDNARAQNEMHKAIAKARIDSLKMEMGAIEDRIGGLSKLFESLASAVEDIAIDSLERTRRLRSDAAAQVTSALNTALQGGGLPLEGQLDNALSVLRNNPADLYASAEEMAYQTAVVQNKLSKLADITGSRLTVDQLTLAALEQQLASAQLTSDTLQEIVAVTETKYDEMIAQAENQYAVDLKALDNMQKQAQEQFDKLTGVDTSVLSVADALEVFNESLLAADFENAEAQLEALDALEATMLAQLDVALGVESAVMSIQESLTALNKSISLVTDRVSMGGLETAESSAAKTNSDLLKEVQALKESMGAANEAIYKETRDGTDILREIRQEQLTI